MGHAPHDIGWCLVGYMDAKGFPHLMEITETAIPWALKGGWSVVLRYSEWAHGDIDPDQSNPRRIEDDGA